MPYHDSRGAEELLRWFSGGARGAAFPQDLLTKILERRKRLLGRVNARFVEPKTAYRLAIGLANPAPTENSGTSWNPTYGIPVIPGASLKGVTRHFIEEELTEGESPATVPAAQALKNLGGDWQQLLDHCRAEHDGVVRVAALAELLFGGTGEDGNEGAVAFFDGWPEPGSHGWLEVEVLTPHHKEYYGDQHGHDAASDHDTPNPVHFLCIRPGVRFVIPLGLTRFGRSLGQPAGEQALDLARSVLKLALEQWGIGAKTGSGYGRMAETITATSPPARVLPPPAETPASATADANDLGNKPAATPKISSGPPTSSADVDGLANKLAAAAAKGLDPFKKELTRQQGSLANLDPNQRQSVLSTFLDQIGQPIEGAKARMVKRLRAVLSERTP